MNSSVDVLQYQLPSARQLCCVIVLICLTRICQVSLAGTSLDVAMGSCFDILSSGGFLSGA